MLNSFSNRPAGVQLWGRGDVVMSAGIGSGTWRNAIDDDDLQFLNETGRLAAPTLLVVNVVTSLNLGTLTVTPTATAFTVSSSDGADTSTLLIWAQLPLQGR